MKLSLCLSIQMVVIGCFSFYGLNGRRRVMRLVFFVLSGSQFLTGMRSELDMTAMRPVMMHGSECLALDRKMDLKMGVAGMKMLKK